MSKFSSQFEKRSFDGPYPQAHTVAGAKVPPDGPAQPQPPANGTVYKQGDELPIGLSYPAGQDFGPYIQRTGQGLPTSFSLDFTNDIPFSCGNVHPHTALLLFTLALNQRPKTILETGTFCGYSTLFLAQALALWDDEGSEVVTIHPTPTFIDEKVKTHPKVRCVQARSEEVLPALLEELEEVQFAFLDSYKRLVYHEFKLVDPYVPPGGLVVFHDTQFLNTGETLYYLLYHNHQEYELTLHSGTPHKDDPHRYFGNADDRGLLVCRKREADPFLRVWDANSQHMEEADRNKVIG